MKIHNLKIEEEYLNAIKNRSKTFEIRYNDRGYQVGDILVFEDPKEESGQYAVFVTYMVSDERFCKENFVTMSIKPIDEVLYQISKMTQEDIEEAIKVKHEYNKNAHTNTVAKLSKMEEQQ